jgi:outer membrane protein, heavy metal efflux system
MSPSRRARDAAWSNGLGAFASLAVCGFGCVPSDAGYQDVRRLTAERIHQDVRWSAHEKAADPGQQVRALLARPLSADSAVQLALLQNQGLQATFEELSVARGAQVEAQHLPNPTADAALRFSGSGPPDIDVQGLISISDLLLLPLRGGAAAANLDAATANVAAQVLDLAFSVRVAFYEYQAAQQTLELSQTTLVALRASFDAAQNLHAAGNITDLNLANERALYEESRISYTRAEAALHAKRQELAALMGFWGPEKWESVPRLADAVASDASLATLEPRAIERSLDLDIIRHRYRAAARGANAASTQNWVPELKAGVSAERDSGEWSVGPAISLELPLFYQGQGGPGDADARRQEKLYADTALRIRAAARGLASRLDAAAQSAEYYKRVLLPLREQIVSGTQLEYNAMNASVFQLLQARREQIQAERAYVELLREYWVLRAEADQLAAGRLPRRVGLVDADATSPDDGIQTAGPGARH